ncbi:MAG: IclR family transcriptional regulator [Sphingobium sp.]
MADPPRGAADRLAYLLKFIANGPARFSLGELAERSNLPASSLHRLLQALLRAGLVERGAGQEYRPGRELHRLASQLIASFDLTRSARPLLERLVEDWHETAVLCAYSPTLRKAHIVEVVMTPHPLRYSVDKGGEIALAWGSLGRAILAFLPPSEIEAVIRGPTVGPLTGSPRLPRPELFAELAKVRTNGHSRYYSPKIEIAGIAAPVLGHGAEILGCIGVTMPSNRYQLHRADNLAVAIQDSASELSGLAAIAYS